MLRHVAEPLDAGGLEADVGVEAPGDGPVDDGLLLLLQQRNELPLGGDVAADAPVRVVQVADDGGLFGEGWEGEQCAPRNSVIGQLKARYASHPFARMLATTCGTNFLALQRCVRARAGCPDP